MRRKESESYDSILILILGNFLILITVGQQIVGGGGGGGILCGTNKMTGTWAGLAPNGRRHRR